MTSPVSYHPAAGVVREGFSRILLATDGSSDAELAARAAVDLAGRAGAALDVVTAWGVPTWPYMYGSGIEEMMESAEANGRQLVDAVAAQATAAGVGLGELRVLSRPPAEAVMATAAGLDDDLIVVGSRGLGGVRRLVVGSVSDAVAHHAGRAVLIVRGGDDAWPPRVVLAADDADEATWPAVRRAATVARLLGTSLELVQVVPPAALIPRAEEEATLASLRTQLEGRAAQLRDLLETPAATQLRVGDTSRELLEAVGDRPGCLLVAGSHGKSTLQRLRLGSVSTNLVHAADCPVLVVPGT